jgi:hypothetical protein
VADEHVLTVTLAAPEYDVLKHYSDKACQGDMGTALTDFVRMGSWYLTQQAKRDDAAEAAEIAGAS